MTAVELLDVTLRLGRRDVLRGADLAISGGEFVGVLGPNGAGKTTLLRAILGLVPAAEGTIRVLGRAAARGNPAIGYMPQVRGDLGAPRLRSRDIVASAVHGHRWGLPILGSADRREVDRALDLVGAAGLASRPLADLSGGERQRVMLAQALIGQPRLLLLDEPLASLDPHRQDEAVALVREIQRRLGLTVLFSAHELNPLLPAMDRVLYLGNGEAALGTVAEVITGPVLSRLYGAAIEVVRLDGRIFVMSGAHAVERDEHCHGARGHDVHV